MPAASHHIQNDFLGLYLELCPVWLFIYNEEVGVFNVFLQVLESFALTEDTGYSLEPAYVPAIVNPKLQGKLSIHQCTIFIM